MDERFDFAEALKRLRAGKKVRRVGWFHMYLYLKPGCVLEKDKLHDPELIQLVDAEMDIYVKPTLVLVHYGLGGWILTGWTAKTEDLLKQDWYEHTTIKEDMEE